MLKAIGVIVILLGTTYYGYFMSFIKTNRIRRMKVFKSTFQLLEGQIRYAYTSMPEALLNIANKSTQQYISQFYAYVAKSLNERTCTDFKEAWNEGIRLYVQSIYLPEEDCEVLRLVGNMPLYLDNQMQMKVIEEAITELEHVITDAQAQIEQKCKIYKCMGFIVGAFIVLILI